MAGPESLGLRVAAHLLNRAAYGPRPGDIAAVLAQGPTGWLEDQLDPGSDPELEIRLAPFTTLSYSIPQVLSLYAADSRTIGVILDDFFAAKVVRAVHARYQLQEVLVDFWFNHFNVFVNDGFDRFSISSYERDAIRPHVFGRFRELLGTATLHPAMLYYLDNYLNTTPRQQGGRTVGGINENHGRELLELHTVGVDAGYTQADVIDASRCLTGHGIVNLGQSGDYMFRAANHDNGTKQVFGLSIPSGGGSGDVQKLLDHLASHPATARYIARRLAERFAADEPHDALVTRLSDVFLLTGGDLRQVMRSLFGSTEFWSQTFGARKVKTGFEYVISALRAAGSEVRDTRAVRAAIQNTGMALYACNPPTGYSNRGVDWLNPSTQLSRMNFGLDLAAGAVAGVAVDIGGVVRGAGGNPDNPGSAAQAMNRVIFGETLSPASLNTAASVGAGGGVPASVRVAGVLFAGPDMQVK